MHHFKKQNLRTILVLQIPLSIFLTDRLDGQAKIHQVSGEDIIPLEFFGV